MALLSVNTPADSDVISIIRQTLMKEKYLLSRSLPLWNLFCQYVKTVFIKSSFKLIEGI